MIDKRLKIDRFMATSGRWAVAVGALLALSACSESKLLLHTAKTLQPHQTNASPGYYKVGNPYQIKGVWYYPAEDMSYDETGIASWYGPGFHEKTTANGEIFDQNDLTAAHRTLPMPSIVEVTNLENGRSLQLRVNDRGPYAYGRILDVSRRGSQLLGFNAQGTARVRVRILPQETAQAVAAMRNGGGKTPPGTQVARADTPIRTDLDVSRPSVGAQTLAPPPGAKADPPSPSKQPALPRANAPERETTQPPRLDGTVTQVAVRPTNLYVQVGAFAQQQNAYQVQVKLNRVPSVNISSTKVNGREFFRVRSGPLASVEQADSILSQVITSGYPDARVVVD
jgi:rare lipoprotein A